MSEEKVRVEEFELSGEKVLAKIKSLVREGNIRRISIQNEEGVTLFELPLMLGVASAALSIWLTPVWAAIGALTAMVAKFRIVVERVEEPKR